ncbi:hypothetical protein CTEN210_18499 [Chaetoceros tenuissimus]|uniref:Importin subunit beta-1/Transportin-1-like TPR repeats domain-containing protein n=1 Tax=Chaetoceros tenuissimus TaxID=426638 RepID=A0AAD3DCS6_9STRA|nr:hypothetical protein CTEN210_18499 [Chaetoceros tenuissimus]
MDFYESCKELPIFQEDSNSDLPPSYFSSFDQCCEAVKSEDSQTRQAAYEFLSDFVQSNYKTLTHHHIEKLVECFSIGIQQNKDVAAIYLWMDICDIEKDLIKKNSGDYRGYVLVDVSTFVTNLLTFALINDDNDPSISEAAAICLKMISQIVKDKIIDEIVSFVEQYIEDEDPRKREARTSLTNHPFESRASPIFSLPRQPTLLISYQVTMSREQDLFDLRQIGEELNQIGEASKQPPSIDSDEIVHFVEQHIEDEDPRKREAAFMAFCSILDGPSTENIEQRVDWIIPFLLEGLNHRHDMVKETSILTIAMIFERHIQVILRSVSFPALVEALMSKLSTENPSSISANAVYAIHNLALAFVGKTENSDTNVLSPYMADFFERLLDTVLREDGGYNKLRSNGWEALSALVRSTAPDCSPALEWLLKNVLEGLEYSLGVSYNPENEIEQCRICSLINDILVSAINSETIIDCASSIVDKMLVLLRSANSPDCHEEAFSVFSEMLVRQFYQMTEENVARVCEQVKVKMNNNSERVCILAVELVSNVAQYSERPVVLEFAQIIMDVLLESLQSENVHDSVKPHVLSCIGDIARAVGRDFQPYIGESMRMLMEASQIAMENNDDCSKQLLEGVLDGYIGIVNGLGKDLLHTYQP